MPKVPEDPEPHGPAEQFGLKLLLLRQLGVLSVLGLNVRPASSSGTQRQIEVKTQTCHSIETPLLDVTGGENCDNS